MGCSFKTGSGSAFYYSTSNSVSTALTSAGTNVPTIASSTSWRLLSIAPMSYSRPSVPDSSLLSDYFEELLAGDLYAIEPLSMQVLWDAVNDATYKFDASNTNFVDCQGSMYLFYPGFPATTGPYLAGTGFLIDVQMPNLQNNERQIGRLTWQFDGKIEPAWYTHTVS